jgi:hypothetical protein
VSFKANFALENDCIIFKSIKLEGYKSKKANVVLSLPPRAVIPNQGATAHNVGMRRTGVRGAGKY